MAMSELYDIHDLSFIQKYRKAWGLGQKALLDEIEQKTGERVSLRVLQRWERGIKRTGEENILLQLYRFMHAARGDVNVLNSRIQKLKSMQLSSDEERIWNQAHLSCLLEVALAGVATARWSIAHPSSQIRVPTSKTKADQSDKTAALDYFVQQKIVSLVEELVQKPDTPWYPGVFFISEETSRLYFGNRKKQDCKVFIIVDPIDYTAGAMRRGEGTILLTVYHRDKGVLASVIVEILGNIVFYRMKGAVSKYVPYLLNRNPLLTDDENELKASLYGPGRDLRPNRLLASLQGASINIYCGSVDRERIFIQRGQNLLQSNLISQLFSIGGALPMARVCESLIDCCLDWKGFFYHDFLPGAFLAEGSGVIIRDMDYNDYTFAAGSVADDYLHHGHSKNESHRSPFICCSTPGLYDDIMHRINSD